MTLRDEVQFALGDGYLVERELGRGGMGSAADVQRKLEVALGVAAGALATMARPSP